MQFANTPTIVLVDDDEALRKALTFSLELDGFVVIALGSGEALLACELPSSPACLVVDHHLAGISGAESLASLRKRAVSLPALLITSQPRRSLREAALALDAVIVEKPLLGDGLRDEIDAALRRHAWRHL